MRGELLGGRYQVAEVLAKGGFGQTYIAKDIHRPGNPPCVVKHLQPTSINSRYLQNARRLFQTEAEILEKLGHHDQIPRLLAYFEENQEFYLVQEFIQGHILTAELQPGKRWSENQVYQLLQEILGILVFVHSHGAIHRDIKPDNIIRRVNDGKLVLVDFGSVKQAWTQVITANEQTNSIFANHLSATIAIGTPGYMPTEQGRGKPQPNSDIYALGMIAIQALTGINPTQLLEESETGEIVWQHQANVSDAIASIITKMVRYNFRNRYQTATEALAAVGLELASEISPDGQPSNTTTSSIQPKQQSSSKNLILLAKANSPRHNRRIAIGGDGEVKRTATNVSITQPTVFVPSEHQTGFLNHTSSGESVVTSPQTNSQPSHTVIPGIQKQRYLRLGAVITAMLTSVIAIYALKWTGGANTEKIDQIPTQTTQKNQKCVQAATQTIPDECRLKGAKQLAAAKDFSGAIALAGQIPLSEADYPAARELIAQWSASLLEIATNHYRSGELRQAIALAKVIPQTSPNYDKTQATIKQWDKEWKINRSNAQAPKSWADADKWHNAIGAAKPTTHPSSQKQIKPVHTQAKISASKTGSKTVVASQPKRTITRRPNQTWAKPVSHSVTSTNRSTKPRQTSSVTRQSTYTVPRRTAAARQLTRTIPRRLPSSLTKPPASIPQSSKPIIYKKVTRSTVKHSTVIIRKQVKRVSKIERKIERSYRWITKTVH